MGGGALRPPEASTGSQGKGLHPIFNRGGRRPSRLIRLEGRGGGNRHRNQEEQRARMEWQPEKVRRGPRDKSRTGAMAVEGLENLKTVKTNDKRTSLEGNKASACRGREVRMPLRQQGGWATDRMCTAGIRRRRRRGEELRISKAMRTGLSPSRTRGSGEAKARRAGTGTG